jgi:hypothetical protein
MHEQLHPVSAIVYIPIGKFKAQGLKIRCE